MALAVALYVALLLLGAAVLAPAAWDLGRFAVERDLVPALRGEGFGRYFVRVLQILALVSIVPFVRRLGVRSWRDLGLASVRGRSLQLLVGVGLGVVSLGALAAAIVLLGLSSPRPRLPWHALPAILIAAALVAPIEEALFRGAFLGVLRRATTAWRAVAWQAAIFASLHFADWRPPRGAAPMQIGWCSGFEHLGLLLSPSSVSAPAALRWTTLFVAGLLLGHLVLRTGGLHAAIGVHAGWIVALRGFESFFTRPPAGLWIGRRLTDGLVPAVVLLLTWGAVALWLRVAGAPRGTPAAAGSRTPSGPR